MNTLQALIFAAYIHALPPSIMAALCDVESNHRPNVINLQDGGSPSYGLCQIKLETARDIGFEGEADSLMNPAINAYYAAKYLRLQLDRYDGNLKKAVAAYNRGHFSSNNPNKVYTDKVFERRKLYRRYDR